LLQKDAKNRKFAVDRCLTPLYTEVMPNKRADNIKRVTVTLDDELLRSLEAECAQDNKNRLELIREAIADYLAQKGDSQKKSK